MSKPLVVVAALIALTLSPAAGFAADDEPVLPCSQADKELNSVYQKVRKTYKDDPLFLAKLKVAQRAWIQFRDAHMDSRYPLPQDQYGSIFGECWCGELASFTEARTRELRQWLKGTEEGDGCSGSYKWDHQLKKK